MRVDIKTYQPDFTKKPTDNRYSGHKKTDFLQIGFLRIGCFLAITIS